MVLGSAIMMKIERRFVDLGESEARALIKGAVAMGVFQGMLLLVLLAGLLSLGLRIAFG